MLLIVFNYWLYTLQQEPYDGVICQKCWQKILHFHRFYIKIQSIHEVISKSKDASDIPLDAVKVELNESTLKCDQTMDESSWSVHSHAMYSDHDDDLSSHNSFGKFTSHVELLRNCLLLWMNESINQYQLLFSLSRCITIRHTKARDTRNKTRKTGEKWYRAKCEAQCEQKSE